ncbi:hypothetical protein QVD17_21622 [Tagetes erecta]|uniref:Uncharacterized protein n=1 Tax=Tagetes erecta TaxID=13708 RepID=A0AAD8NT86_TARER|nr:hypothetical protein QVD17_21622 [Tagetes erecta]
MGEMSLWWIALGERRCEEEREVYVDEGLCSLAVEGTVHEGFSLFVTEKPEEGSMVLGLGSDCDVKEVIVGGGRWPQHELQVVLGCW